MGTNMANRTHDFYRNDYADQNPPYTTPRAYPMDSFDQSGMRSAAPQSSTSGGSGSNSAEDQKHRFASLGAGIASWLSEHILLHPFIVIRRQCQVNHDCYWYHTTPFTLITPIFNIQRHQGWGCLWKGVVSTLVVKAIGYASESTISEFTSLPKEVTRHSSLRKIVEHLFLKGLSCVIMTPFYAASLVETVQAIEKDIEHPGILDWLKEGCARMLSITSPSGTRQLLIWKLFFPTVVYGVCHYVISSLAQYNAVLLMKNEMAEDKDRSLDHSHGDCTTVYETYYPELFATFIGHLLADITLFPLETVLHRLCVQGTRTIIDNTDTGLDVIPTITSYEGPIDCIRSIIQDEGFSGFYKGFGALILQYAMHQVILKFTRSILERVSTQDSGAPVLGSDFSRMQSMSEDHMNRNLPPFPSQGDQPSFNMDRNYSTSTPYNTPHPSTSYPSHTGTGVARR